MISRNVILRFPRECVGEPVISSLIGKYKIDVNILHARINPSEEGRMHALVCGMESLVMDAIEFLSSAGVEVHLPEDSFIWQKEKCIHCGACAGICPSEAFTLNRRTFEVEYNLSKCILCGLCREACYYGAILSTEDYVERSGVFK